MFGASRLALFAANPVSVGVTGGYALFAGGYDEGTIEFGARTDDIKKYNLSTDAVSTISAVLPSQLDQVCGFANGTKGILSGGSTGSSTNQTSIITLSDETLTGGQALTVNTLSTRQGRGTSSSTTGYMLGGITTAPVNDVKKYTYSSDTWGYTTNGLGYTSAVTTCAVHCNSTKAINAGGYIESTTTPQSTVKEFDFSTESTSTASYSLNTAIAQACCTGNQDKWISFSGFVTTSVTLTTIVESYTFASGARTSATALTYGFRTGDAAGDDSRGIIAGGYSTGGGTYSTTTNWIYTYSSDTYANATNYLYTGVLDLPGALHSLQVS